VVRQGAAVRALFLNTRCDGHAAAKDGLRPYGAAGDEVWSLALGEVAVHPIPGPTQSAQLAEVGFGDSSASSHPHRAQLGRDPLGASQPGYDWSKDLHRLAWHHDVAETPPFASLNQALA
jgi:hypothetical protein